MNLRSFHPGYFTYPCLWWQGADQLAVRQYLKR
jgi:hypothetical protein